MTEMETKTYIDELMKKARAAQAIYSDHPTQERYDKDGKSLRKNCI